MALADNICLLESRVWFRIITLEGGDRRDRALYAEGFYISQRRFLGEGALSRRSQTRKYHCHCPEYIGSRSAAIGT